MTDLVTERMAPPLGQAAPPSPRMAPERVPMLTPAPRGTGSWNTRVTRAPHQRAPLVWLLGATGGAGVSMLAASLAYAGDAQRRWPSLVGYSAALDSPLVVIVTRTHMSGLHAAHNLLLQHASAATPTGVQLVGVVTVADTDRPLSSPVAARRAVVESLAADLDARVWRLGWIEPWRSLTTDDLAIWSPGYRLPEDKQHRRDPSRTPPPPVRELAAELLTAARSATASGRGKPSTRKEST
ncbi:hypothetical protein [Antrihabitans spumae]|uniref:Uncharacterized protein n=1 Tax=Antrihabitans spumae TaxID=3373370 RepID=A0ABW7KNU6_9NOCA